MCMKFIKKILTTPLPKNSGAIIDGYNTSDDPTTNTYSMRVIKQRCKLKEDFAILTGQVSMAADSTSSFTINYPIGFTADNCVPIACGLKVLDAKGFNYVAHNADSVSILNNGYNRLLNLQEANIQLRVTNPDTTSAKTVNYKIVLMKV